MQRGFAVCSSRASVRHRADVTENRDLLWEAQGRRCCLGQAETKKPPEGGFEFVPGYLLRQLRVKHKQQHRQPAQQAKNPSSAQQRQGRHDRHCHQEERVSRP